MRSPSCGHSTHATVMSPSVNRCAGVRGGPAPRTGLVAGRSAVAAGGRVAGPGRRPTRLEVLRGELVAAGKQLRGPQRDGRPAQLDQLLLRRRLRPEFLGGDGRAEVLLLAVGGELRVIQRV